MECDFLFPFVKGCCVSGALIVAIGAQNAFVLSQGIKKEYVFTIALICAVIDAILISAGIGGVGIFINRHQNLVTYVTWGGALFLTIYGLQAARSAFKVQAMDSSASPDKKSLSTIIVTLLALSLLNPHVYLDTVILIGSVGAKYPDAERLFFALGAICISFIWFFSLAYGARFLRPLFEKPRSWQILNFFIAVTMWTIAAMLIFGLFDSDPGCY